MTAAMVNLPKVFLFDYGGVLAAEGFEAGLRAIGAAGGLIPDDFFQRATELIYACGYVTGKGTESQFWALVRQEFGISGSDQELSNQILARFILRPAMMAMVRAIKKAGVRTAILSDQTDWLAQLDRRDHFLGEFAPVLNSFHLGSTKREMKTFAEALRLLGCPAQQVLFVDDNPGHIDRAEQLGLQTHHFINEKLFRAELFDRGIVTGEGKGK